MFKVIAAAAGGLVLCLSAADAGVLAPVPSFPGATQTFAYGINNHNVVAGRYVDSEGVQHGFFGTLDGNYTSFDFPGGGNSFVTSINDDGDITGESEVLTADCPIFGCEYMRRSNGHMVEIKKKRAPLDGQAEQIIQNEKFVGEYWFVDHQGNTHANGYRGRSGDWVKDIVLPFDGVTRTRPRGYNKKGEIVGFYSASPAGGGFVLKDGIATSVTFPDADATTTMLTGLNGTGKIVGSWNNSDDTAGQAFIYESDKDSFRVIAVPGETLTAARQVNDAGVVTILGAAGSYIYCTHKRNCPVTAGAIEVSEKVVPARHPGNTQWVVCKSGCMRDVGVTPKAASLAAVSEAIRHDPSLAREMRDSFR
jgi:hypothetical protein